MDCVSRKTGIPSLCEPSGKWVHDGKGKADLFADVLTSKFVLPDPVIDDPSLDDSPTQQMSSFVLIRERWVRRELRVLREDQATGPDELPARILRRCAAVLARPLTALLRQIVRQQRWPALWKIHRLSPLFRKGLSTKQRIIEACI